MKYDELRKAKQDYNRYKTMVRSGRKYGDVARDLAETSQGVKSNPRRKRFWEKKPFQNAVAALAIMGGTTAAMKYGPAIAKKVLLAERARILYLRNKGYTIELDWEKAEEEGWHVRNPTGTSIKIQRGRRNKRLRRKKHGHETVDFKNKLIGGLAAGLVGTAGLGAYLALLARKRGKIVQAARGKTNRGTGLTKGEKEYISRSKNPEKGINLVDDPVVKGKTPTGTKGDGKKK